MLSNPTLEKMKELNLLGMAKAFEDQLKTESYKKLSFEERLAYLIEMESLCRDNRKLASRLKNAKLRHGACIEDIDFTDGRKLDKNLILSLSKCKWIKEHRNVLITGVTGVGKSYIACALAHKACLEGYTALYMRVPKLFSELAVARGDGRYPKIIMALSKIDILIIDDWGLSKLNENERKDFLEIIEDRYELRSTIITGQVPVKKWHELIGEPTFADAILDRLIHNSYRIELSGESMRKIKNEIKDEPKEKDKK